jgi:hypothetical protein
MSRGQLARTPANFPRMKHRAAGRLARRRAAEQLPSLLEALALAVRPVVDVFKALGDAFMQVGAAIYQPAVMTTRPQDWAPPARAMIWPQEWAA